MHRPCALIGALRTSAIRAATSSIERTSHASASNTYEHGRLSVIRMNHQISSITPKCIPQRTTTIPGILLSKNNAPSAVTRVRLTPTDLRYFISLNKDKPESLTRLPSSSSNSRTLHFARFLIPWSVIALFTTTKRNSLNDASARSPSSVIRVLKIIVSSVEIPINANSPRSVTLVSQILSTRSLFSLAREFIPASEIFPECKYSSSRRCNLLIGSIPVSVTFWPTLKTRRSVRPPMTSMPLSATPSGRCSTRRCRRSLIASIPLSDTAVALMSRASNAVAFLSIFITSSEICLPLSSMLTIGSVGSSLLCRYSPDRPSIISASSLSRELSLPLSH
jgi:hypothetical protein